MILRVIVHLGCQVNTLQNDEGGVSVASERLNSSLCGGWADPGQEEVGEDFLQRGSAPRAQLSEPRQGGCSVRKQDSGCVLDLPVEALSLDLQAPELVLDEVSQGLPHLQLRRSEKEHEQMSHDALTINQDADSDAEDVQQIVHVVGSSISK